MTEGLSDSLMREKRIGDKMKLNPIKLAGIKEKSELRLNPSGQVVTN